MRSPFYGRDGQDSVPTEKGIVIQQQCGRSDGLSLIHIYLGINAVELIPIFEFDEMESARVVDGVQLYNYWGYNTVSFFAPNTSYAFHQEHNHEGDELKRLIRELKENGIEVILDAVSYTHLDVYKRQRKECVYLFCTAYSCRNPAIFCIYRSKESTFFPAQNSLGKCV